ncbi:MAG: sulfotransferase [Myxococcota bacterium]|nr:sulfotransferase [Myxococcota bacterium]
MEFDEQSVLDEARRGTGLADFGDEGFREGLRVLLATYRDTAGFHEKGVKRNRRRVVQLLQNRLRIQDALTRHPEIREREIKSPVVLTGLPRSGTSALFNLLGADPAARPLRLWEALFPWPMEGLELGQPDPRREAIEQHYARGREKNPDFTKIHYTSADTPEECVVALSHDFCDVQMGIEPMMEPYGSWFLEQDLRRTYRYYRDLLKMLDWQRPGERWLLKAPAHMWGIDALIETFPDVCVVWTHRNPLQCTASICSMTATLMAGRESFDPKELGPVVMEFYAKSLERGLAARDRHDPGRFVDVDYGDFVADPLAVARQVYDHFGLPLGPGVKEALETHAREHPQGKHGRHEYSLDEYGLSPERVRERFASYVERYGLPVD